MQKVGSTHLLSASRGLLLVLMFLMPLFFLPVTLEPLELNKQTLLLILTCAAALCWLGSMILERRIQIRRGWSNVLPWLLVLAFVLSASYSIAPYLSWVGAHRQEYTSVLTIMAVAILFFLLANLMGARQQHRQVHLTLLLSTSLAALLALLETVGFPVVSQFVPSLILNTIGTLTSFAAWLVVLSTFFLGSFLAHHKDDSLLHDGRLGHIEMVLTIVVSLATLFFLILIDDAGIWTLFSLSLAALFVFVVFRAKDFPHRARLVWPLVLLITSLLFWFVLPGISSISIPIEVTPNTASSQIVAEQTLQTYSSSWGSGPGTYQYDYSQFHDVSLNETDFWNTRFDRASSFVLTLVPTIGVFGMTLLGLFVLGLFVRAIIQVLKPKNKDEWLESFVHLSAWISLVLSAFFVSWNMTLVVSFGVFSGLLASQVMRTSWTKSFSKAQGAALLLCATAVVFALVFLVGIFVTTQRYAAEMAFARAIEIDREGGELQQVVSLLDRASTLNTYHDTYYRNLGEALLLRVDEELEGVSSVDTLTDESSQYLQSLTAAAVNASAQATSLSPHNVLNWLSRGFVYRELAPVLGDAVGFAVVSFEKAVELEPLNPANWTQLGIANLASAEQARALTLSSDTNIAAQAMTQLTQLLNRAQGSFERAIELKANYAPAHFQLAVTYERQGRLDDAIGKMESVWQYNQLDVGVSFQLGMLYLQRNDVGDAQRAQAALEHTIKLAPDNANAHWFLASMYEAQGDLARAVAEIEAVLDLSPGNEIVQARLERLLTGQISTEVPEAIE
jgi:tetratricopeptide (TPR) repeat protein